MTENKKVSTFFEKLGTGIVNFLAAVGTLDCVGAGASGRITEGSYSNLEVRIENGPSGSDIDCPSGWFKGIEEESRANLFGFEEGDDDPVRLLFSGKKPTVKSIWE